MNKKILPLLILPLLLTGCQKDTTDTTSFPDSVTNGSFEDGITGWTVSGEGAFTEEDIVNIDTFNDGLPTNKEGSYCYVGGYSSLPSFTGSLISDPFVLEGIGQITLKIGAMKNKENCYIEFFEYGKTEPLSFIVNQKQETVTKLTNDDFNDSTIKSQLIRQVVDLSDYFEKVIYIKVTDNDRNSDYIDYSFVNLDDVRILKNAQELNDARTQREEQLIEYHDEVIDNDPPVTELRNGGFETGDLSYWKILKGNAFTQGSVSLSSENFWTDRKHNASGNYFLNGYKNAENLTGTIRSEKFLVTDQGNNTSYASVLLGGIKDASGYIAVNNGLTGEELIKIKNIAFKDPELSLSLVRYYVDLSNYIGQTLYFTINDNATSGGFAAINADEFRINLSQETIINERASLVDGSLYNDDSVAKNAYIDAYNNVISFPVGGDAPVISVDENDYAYQTMISASSSYNLVELIKNTTIKDDYTVRNDLVIRSVSLSRNGTTLEDVNYYACDLSQNGTYLYTFSATDAYNNVSVGTIKIEVVTKMTYDNNIVNGGFETGDATGWTITSGSPNLNAAICSLDTFWSEEIPYNKTGTYFFNGWDAGVEESNGFSFKSTNFTLGGSGQISFKLGGRSTRVIVRRENGEMIAKYENYNFADVNFPSVSNGCRLATMVTYVADLSDYIGENLYIELVDEVIDGGWQVVFFDEIVTYYETEIDVSTKFDTVSQVEVTGNPPVVTDIPWANAINTL
ncbi:MAG: hypothetical protein ACI31G_05080 [Bacilli bacterium]